MLKKKANTNRTNTVIGSKTEIIGSIISKESVKIDGKITAWNSDRIIIKENFIVGKNGEVIADIEAKKAVIGGKVQGFLKCTESLEILSTAVIEGDIDTNRLYMEEGAVIEGQCSAHVKEEGSKLEKGPYITLLPVGEGEGDLARETEVDAEAEAKGGGTEHPLKSEGGEQEGGYSTPVEEETEHEAGPKQYDGGVSEAIDIHTQESSPEKQQSLEIKDFIINTNNEIEKCPNGKFPIEASYRSKKKYMQAYFKKEDCKKCAQKSICPVKEQKEGMLLHVTKKELREVRKQVNK